PERPIAVVHARPGRARLAAGREDDVVGVVPDEAGEEEDEVDAAGAHAIPPGDERVPAVLGGHPVQGGEAEGLLAALAVGLPRAAPDHDPPAPASVAPPGPVLRDRWRLLLVGRGFGGLALLPHRAPQGAEGSTDQVVLERAREPDEPRIPRGDADLERLP